MASTSGSLRQRLALLGRAAGADKSERVRQQRRHRIAAVQISNPCCRDRSVTPSRVGGRCAEVRTHTASRKLVVRDTVLNVQVPLSGGYDFAREVSAPESPVRRFGDNPRTVQPPLRLTGRQIATS
jgi:hypothetical protein